MNPLTNPPSNTADAVMAEAAGPVDALDAILRQIVNGYFVLTDGQGSVSKWSEPAELLFDQPSEDILGQNFFATLIGGTLPPAGQAWREFLDLGEPPRVPGTVQLVGRRGDGDEFPMEAVFVPVKLDEGFDFSLFLEDLSFELPHEPDAAAHAPAAPGRRPRAQARRSSPRSSRGRAGAPPARSSSSARCRRPRGSRPSSPAARPSARSPTPRPRSA